MSIFREYDIRGVYGTDLTETIAEGIGKSFGTVVHRSGGKTISLGYDVRLSTPALKTAFLKGLATTGINVIDIGECPTPVLYFSLYQLPVDGGAMITASHNPGEFNGFKLCNKKHTLFGDEIQEINTLIENNDFEQSDTSGQVSSEENFLSVYSDYLFEQFGRMENKKIVIDCGNGAAALNAPDIFRRLGFEVIPLFCEADGTFPNHHPDPTVSKNLEDLIAAVQKENAAAGIAFDGDGDRIGVVDEKGDIIWGDRLTLLFAMDILKSHPGATIISEVKASQVFYDEVARLGGNGIMWKTGHSLMKSKMKESGALLAGEMSGHIFFADRYFGYDDATYAGCRLLEILIKGQKPLSSYFDHLPNTYVTPEIRVDCPDDLKFEITEKCREFFSKHFKTIDIDGVRIILPDGWGLIRASNTQPALVLRFEASTQDRLEKNREGIEKYLNILLSEIKK